MMPQPHEGADTSYRPSMAEVKQTLTAFCLCAGTALLLFIETSLRVWGTLAPEDMLLACSVLFNCAGLVVRSATIIVIERAYMESIRACTRTASVTSSVGVYEEMALPNSRRHWDGEKWWGSGLTAPPGCVAPAKANSGSRSGSKSGSRSGSKSGGRSGSRSGSRRDQKTPASSLLSVSACQSSDHALHPGGEGRGSVSYCRSSIVSSCSNHSFMSTCSTTSGCKFRRCSSQSLQSIRRRAGMRRSSSVDTQSGGGGDMALSTPSMFGELPAVVVSSATHKRLSLGRLQAVREDLAEQRIQSPVTAEAEEEGEEEEEKKEDEDELEERWLQSIVGVADDQHQRRKSAEPRVAEEEHRLRFVRLAADWDTLRRKSANTPSAEDEQWLESFLVQKAVEKQSLLSADAGEAPECEQWIESIGIVRETEAKKQRAESGEVRYRKPLRRYSEADFLPFLPEEKAICDHHRLSEGHLNDKNNSSSRQARAEKAETELSCIASGGSLLKIPARRGPLLWGDHHRLSEGHLNDKNNSSSRQAARAEKAETEPSYIASGGSLLKIPARRGSLFRGEMRTAADRHRSMSDPVAFLRKRLQEMGLSKACAEAPINHRVPRKRARLFLSLRPSEPPVSRKKLSRAQLRPKIRPPFLGSRDCPVTLRKEKRKKWLRRTDKNLNLKKASSEPAFSSLHTVATENSKWDCSPDTLSSVWLNSRSLQSGRF